MTRTRTGKGLVVGGIPRVNLLPPDEVERRSLRTLRMRWLRAFIAAFVLVAMVWVVGLWSNLLAHGAADSTVRDSEQLQSQLAGYSAVIDLQSEVRNLKAFREQAGSNDLDWWRLMAAVKSVLPVGVDLVGFRLAPGAAPVAGTDASTQVGLRGTLTFTAKATSAQTETITRLREVPGVIAVDAGALASDGPAGGFTFVTTFSADQTFFTGRFVQLAGR